MGIVELIIMLGIGAVSAYIASNIMSKNINFIFLVFIGLFGSVIGTFVGGMISPALGLNLSGLVGTLLWATIGSIVVLFIGSLLPGSNSTSSFNPDVSGITNKIKSGFFSGIGGVIAYVIGHSVLGFGIPEASIAAVVSMVILGAMGFNA